MCSFAFKACVQDRLPQLVPPYYATAQNEMSADEYRILFFYCLKIFFRFEYVFGWLTVGLHLLKNLPLPISLINNELNFDIKLCKKLLTIGNKTQKTMVLYF